MAVFSAGICARTEPCRRLSLEPHLRVRPLKIFKCTSGLRLGFHLRFSWSLGGKRGCGRCLAQAATEDRRSLVNGGFQNCTYYDFLGLPRDATQKNIKEAYRKSAKIWHPDIAMKGKLQKCTEEFVKIHDAYVVLSDPETRAQYDEQLRLQSLKGRRVNGRFPGVLSFDESSGDEASDCYLSAAWRRNWETDQCW